MRYSLAIGDSLTELKKMADQSVQCWVTSPPYWGLRDYGVDGQLGLEKTPDEYVAKIVEIFREARRVLRDDGTLWLNLGDSYSGSRGNRGEACHDVKYKRGGHIENMARPTSCVNNYKPKDLIGIPWLVAFAMRADGWYLRQDIIWSKPNPMPESVKDRCTKSHEYIFLLSKSDRYYFDQDAIKEPADTKNFRDCATRRRDTPPGTGTDSGFENGRYYTDRNKRSVWAIPTKPFPQAHFATFPPALVEPCILAGCPEGGVVGDMFAGSGTTGIVALKHFRRFVGIELNPVYANDIAIPRLESEANRFKQEPLF